MNKTNDGGPAFPYYHPDLGGAAGMSLRDYFAGEAMGVVLQGALQLGAAAEGEDALPIAQAAYTMADAMLKAREL